MKTIKNKIYLAFLVPIVMYSCTKEPSPDFNFNNDNSYAPVEVSFTNLTVDAESYSWDFGDGGVSTEKNPTHLYETSGTFIITLDATNGNKTKSVRKTITLLSLPDFIFSNNSVYAPVEISFTNLTVYADSYSWDFGDGGVSNEKNPKHLYETSGIFSVTLNATTGSTTKSVTKTLTLYSFPVNPVTHTTFSILNATSNYVISGIISAYYDPLQDKFIDAIEHGALIPTQKTNPVETSYSSRVIFFSGVSSTLIRVKYPYSIKKNVENTLAIYDTTTVVLSYIKKDIAFTASSFSENTITESPTQLDVQLSGCKYQ